MVLEFKNNKYYVAGNGYYTDSAGNYLHHQVLKPKKGFVVDHIDGNKLNNNPENLRYVSKSQNAINSKPFNSTKVKGVYLDIHRSLNKKYRVMLSIEGNNCHFGYYESLDEAAHVSKMVRDQMFE